MNSVIESLILDQIYHCLSYITPVVALELFCDGMVTSLQLEFDGNANYFCKSCIVGKFTQIPIMKLRQRERSTGMCEKIHSDIWGPIKVEMKID